MVVAKFSWWETLAEGKAGRKWGQGIYFFFFAAGLKDWQWLCSSAWGHSTYPVGRDLSSTAAALSKCCSPFSPFLMIHPYIMRPRCLPSLICSFNPNHTSINCSFNMSYQSVLWVCCLLPDSHCNWVSQLITSIQHTE